MRDRGGNVASGNWIDLDGQGLLNGQRIVAVGNAHSAGMRRLLGAVPDEKVVDLTGGRRRQCLVVLDSGHVVITASTLQRLQSGLFMGYASEGAEEG
jgi:regulator of extracellular matrix RemA (YlzA/DUF370 family)